MGAFVIPQQMDTNPPGLKMAPKTHTTICYTERGKPYAFLKRAPAKPNGFVGRGAATKRSGYPPQGGCSGVEFAATRYRPRKGKKWRRG